MKYTHITVYVVAAEKYYKAIWINSDELKHVIIYLRDFHDFMHFFSNCGKFVSDSGFEEILHETRMFSVGGIRPVLSRKSLQHVLDNSRNSCRSNEYVSLLISVILVSQSKLDHSTLKISKEFDLMTSSYIHT